MKILFYNSNTHKIDNKNFSIYLYPSCKNNFDKLVEKYPEHEFIVVTQKPGMFLVDLVEGVPLELSEKVSYFFLDENTSPLDFANFIVNIKPDYAISTSYWIAPYDWLSLNDGIIAEHLKQHNINTISNNLKSQEICFDKWQTNQFFKNNNFLCPNAIFFNHSLFWAERSNKNVIHNPYKTSFLEKLKQLKYPVVIKNLYSFSSYSTDVAKSFSEALHFLSQKGGNEDKIIEEYIDGEHLGVEVFCSKNKPHIFSPFLFSLNKYGITCPKQSMKFGPININKKDFYGEINRLSSLLDFSASYQIDLIFSNNRFYFIEINPRLSGLTNCYTSSTNKSILELLIDICIYNKIPTIENYNLYSVKIDLQSKQNLKQLEQNQAIKAICQIENKNAKQKRDKGFCEIITTYEKLKNINPSFLETAKDLTKHLIINKKTLPILHSQNIFV